MTNREALRDVIEDIRSEGGIPQEQMNTILLTSIANSLTIIADTLTDMKGNSNGEKSEVEEIANSMSEDTYTKGMTIDFIKEEKDIVKEVHITTSPIEYIIISAALKQFIENSSNYESDIEIAKQMRKVIENYGNNNTNQNYDFDS